ncbi:hypothetical protein CR162_16915 [Pseudoroseomonas rhizosphaerae]|uniref:Uncharacterized protein n=1 Tax=Teichococcus rhizosphaerae TaxID=1335062 RepID=A0A2C7AAZ5_9PROT|nr:hypothetical protein [Pseudoroseomonas rhizosphaerae]PHK93797.1 hypothetical protein CR162_16915 [Pseudoroseomonas rhizosphaerae]
MKARLFARLCWLRLLLAIGEWRVRRMAQAMERAHGLPAGWLILPGNAQRFAEWERQRQVWRRSTYRLS